MQAADGVLPAAHLDEKILDPWLNKMKGIVISGWDWIILRDSC